MTDVELMTIKEVAAMLKISEPSVRRLQQERHVPFLKIRGAIRFEKTDILNYLKKVRIESIR